MYDMMAETAKIIVPLRIPASLNMIGRLSIAAPSMLFSKARMVVEEEFFASEPDIDEK